MDSDYHLFGSEEKIEKKEEKEHGTAYHRFVNQFRNHLKKIENQFSGDEANPLTNQFNFINKYENEFEEKRENCLNCYKALKEQITIIEKYIPDFDITLFTTFFQAFDEYYSFFTKAQEILRTFAKHNDDTQNLYYICKRKNFCIEALKDFVDTISKEYADKIEQYEILKKNFKELKDSYEKLYKIYQENRNTDLDKFENTENKDLIISKLNQKIQDLNIENDRINKKYLECSRELERINMDLKFNYILKMDSEKKINELKYKIMNFENENIRLKKEIKEIKKENEKLIEQKEYFENHINEELNNININENNYDNYNNINNNDNNNGNNNENNINNDNNNIKTNINDNLIEHKNEEEEEIDNGRDLMELLEEYEEVESNEINEEKREEQKIEDQNMQNNNSNDKNVLISINENNEKENKTEPLKNKINNNIKSFNRSKTVRFYTKENNSKIINKKRKKTGEVKFEKGKSVMIPFVFKKSDNIKSAYDIMFKGRQFEYPTSIASGRNGNHDYFKQFFFLLFQSMKMNSNNLEQFLKYSPEDLYNNCRREHIPFHKYQKWIEKKLLKNEIIENSKKYEDFATITGIFCSSLI